jgi:hypothetical protein
MLANTPIMNQVQRIYSDRHVALVSGYFKMEKLNCKMYKLVKISIIFYLIFGFADKLLSEKVMSSDIMIPSFFGMKFSGKKLVTCFYDTMIMLSRYMITLSL